MTGQYLSKDKLAGALAEGRGVWSASAEQASDREPTAALTEPRSPLSPKAWLYPSLESVGRYGAAVTGQEASAQDAGPMAIIGLRACELRAIEYLDRTLLGDEFQDPLYRARRQSAVLVSTDCRAPAEMCFCTSVGGSPFPEAGYDVNLSPVTGGFVVDAPTDRGRAWLARAGLSSEPASPPQVAERDAMRQAAVEAVKRQNGPHSLVTDASSPLDLPDDGDESWQRFAADCVECGACTNVCPTCYCFYLYDQTLGAADFQRVRAWDSCLLGTYHRMAGTTPNMKPTPRPRLSSRLANRILHKFRYAPQQCGMIGCVGCGRCIEACLGALDIRDVAGEMKR